MLSRKDKQKLTDWLAEFLQRQEQHSQIHKILSISIYATQFILAICLAIAVASEL